MRLQISLREFIYSVAFIAAALAATCALGFDFVWRLWGFGMALASVLGMVFALARLERLTGPLTPIESLWCQPLIYFLAGFCFALLDILIDQDFLDAYGSNSFTTFLVVAMTQGLSMAGAVLVLVPFDFFVQHQQPLDTAFYPRLDNLVGRHANFASRLGCLIAIGFSLGHYAFATTSDWSAGLYGDPIWRAPRVFIACQLLWSGLWIVDAHTHRDRGGKFAATMFMFLSLAAAFFNGPLVWE